MFDYSLAPTIGVLVLIAGGCRGGAGAGADGIRDLDSQTDPHDQSFSFAVSLILRNWIALPSAVKRIDPVAMSQPVARFTSRPLSVRVTVPPSARIV